MKPPIDSTAVDMPDRRESVIAARETFCAGLKAARERKGITLAAIADSTKVSESLFAGLERNDLGRWPKGIFRRAFLRDYARTVGLPVNQTADEFARLFPDDDAASEASIEEHSLRMTLDPAWRGRGRNVPRQMLAALIDLAVVGLGANILTWQAGADPGLAMAVVSMGSYTLATIFLGGSLGLWLIRGGTWRRTARSFAGGSRAKPTARAAIPAEVGSRARLVQELLLRDVSQPQAGMTRWRGIRLVLAALKRTGSEITLLGARAIETSMRVSTGAVHHTHDESQVAGASSWISDARRVRPRTPSPRFRLRLWLSR